MVSTPSGNPRVEGHGRILTPWFPGEKTPKEHRRWSWPYTCLFFNHSFIHSSFVSLPINHPSAYLFMQRVCTTSWLCFPQMLVLSCFDLSPVPAASAPWRPSDVPLSIMWQRGWLALKGAYNNPRDSAGCPLPGSPLSWQALTF